MIVTRNWLSKYINLANISNAQIAIALNSLGFEVEEEHDYSKMNDTLVIGYIEKSEPIKDTHLRFNIVNIGSKTLEIVCGAPNVDAGQFVIIAQVGQTIANGLTLGEREIKGYKSQGMICALNEIGLKDSVLTEKESDSIYVINSKNITKENIGNSIATIGFEDYIWDIDLTLNRSDALAATQLLKEIANYFELVIDWTKLNIVRPHTSDAITKVIVNSQLENEIRTVAVQEIKINIVNSQLEATDDLLLKFTHAVSTENFVEDLAMLSTIESGQPIIVIDKAKLSGELKLETININDKLLVALTNEGILVNLIGSVIEPNFKVSETTSDIVVIYLNLNPVLMRKQQKALDFSSIEIQRYMKPLNPNLFEFSSKVFESNLERYDVKISSTNIRVDIQKVKTNNVFEITLTKIKEFLGISLTMENIKELFKTLDINIQSKDDNLIFTVDQNRTDLYGQFDICEEVARLYGYDKIIEVAPSIVARRNSKNIELKLQTKIGDHLIGLGFYNTKTYSLISSEESSKWDLFRLGDSVNLMSPLSKLHESYRLSLINSLINTSAYNSSMDNKKIKLWEIADIYTPGLIRERHLAALITGNILDDEISGSKIENNYFYMKGIIASILNLYKINESKISFILNENLIDEIHPYVNAEIKYDDKLLGFIFKLNPRYANNKKIATTFAFELNLSMIEQIFTKIYTINSFSKFQQSSRDISLLVNNNIRYEDLHQQLITNVNNLVDIKLIDQYEDETLISSNQKALTISFTFNNSERQMSEADINEQWETILLNVKKLELTVR